MKKYFSPLLFLFILFISLSSFSQSEKEYKVVCVGFYNLENLFDTILNPELLFAEEFTPEGSSHWTSERYHEKLDHMSYAISKIATDVSPDGVAVLGISEIENKGVIEDLVKEDAIKDRDYQIVHYDTPDRRGIDVALLYNPKYFKVTNWKAHPLTFPDNPDYKTRSQLVVTGLLDGEEVSIIVNHWPSRRGGEKKSRPKRNAAGDLSRHIVDSLLAINKDAKIMLMGDLNDDPVNPSVLEHLRAKGKESQLTDGDMFNPMWKLYKEGIGSLAYRDKWNLFDQIIISQGLLGNDSTYKFYKARVFNKPFLKQKEGRYKGYPWRTFAGGVYIGGYSDHFPVYIMLIKEAE